MVLSDCSIPNYGMSDTKLTSSIQGEWDKLFGCPIDKTSKGEACEEEPVRKEPVRNPVQSDASTPFGFGAYRMSD